MDVFEEMDRSLELMIEFCLSLSPYKMDDLLSFDFEQFFRIYNRANKRHKKQTEALEKQKK